MNPVRIIAATLLVAAMALPASAQSTGTRIAIANPARIFNELQETRDLIAKMENERRALETTAIDKRKKIEDLQNARESLRPDSPQYAERNRELLQLSLEFRVWQEMAQQDLNRQQKTQMKNIFDKITQTVGEVATQKGIDLVVAETRPEIRDLEPLTVDQLRILLNQRNVLFNAPSVDISNDVILALDAKYKAGN